MDGNNTYINTSLWNLFVFTDDESDERLALCLLVPLFTAKRCTNVVNSLYEKCLVS